MTSSQLNIEIVGSKISLLGEGPVWDAKQGIIYWIDILNGQLHSHHPKTNTEASIALDQMIGSFALSDHGKIYYI